MPKQEMNPATTTKNISAFNNGPVYRNRREEGENLIDFSSLRQVHAHFASRSFSIKYVLSGTEQYKLQGRNYDVGQGRYLLTNAFTEGDVTIDSAKDVRGVCIELSPGILAEVLAVNLDLTSPYPEKDMYDFLTTADFFEHDYDAGKTRLGAYLQETIPRLSAGDLTDQLCMGQFFYGIAERVIRDQQEVHKYFGSMQSVKGSTKKDLLNRLLKGKELMDDSYTHKLGISEIAQTATMSEYYFLRLFKKTFHCSPHRYLVEKRLQKASLLLHQGHEPIAVIAYECGFADIHSFSKAFKKRFGNSPSALKNAHCDFS